MPGTLRHLPVVFGKALAGLVILLFGAAGAVIVLSWWGSRLPRRPSDISTNGVFLERGAVPFKFSTHGDWADCWEDFETRSIRCKVTDEAGIVKFEDVFIPYDANSKVTAKDLKAKDLRIDAQKTSSLITDPPIIFLSNGQVLLSKGQFAKAKEQADTWARPSSN